jgi:prepilin-type processing-associated H-X9-DG protein
VPLLQIAVISGRVWDWPAGPAWGPRLLSPMIPLLALPCACGMWSFPKLALPLAAYSISITTLATLTDACPQFSNHPNPLLDLHVPLFFEGEFSPNLGLVLGLPPFASVTLFYGLLLAGIVWLSKRLPAVQSLDEGLHSRGGRNALFVDGHTVLERQ